MSFCPKCGREIIDDAWPALSAVKQENTCLENNAAR